MEIEFFKTQIQRLIDTYGKNAYPPERVALFFKEFSGQQNQVFANAISSLIQTDRSAPMVERIREAVDIAKREYFDTGLLRLADLNPKNPTVCEYCNDSGYITEPYLLRCSCYVGRSRQSEMTYSKSGGEVGKVSVPDATYEQLQNVISRSGSSR